MQSAIKRILQSKLYWNIFTNGAGRLWSSLLTLVSVPIIMKFLGPEAYGLVGLYSTLEVVFNFLDLGLSATVNREIARNIALGKDHRDNRNLLRTLEIFYWLIGVGAAVIIAMGADWISANWVQIKVLTVSQVRMSIYIMAFLFAARWPLSLYTGVFRGLQKQYLQNLLAAIMATIRVVGAVLILYFFSAQVVDYLIWIAAVAFGEIFLLIFLAWKELNRTAQGQPSFDLALIKNIWKFALSFNLVGVLGMLLSQADRLIASKFVNLSEIGYYSVAGTAVGSLSLISYSIMTAVFPRFSADTATENRELVRRNFHRSGWTINYFNVGLGLVLIFFPANILLLWTRDTTLVQHTSLVLLLLAVANMLNSFFNSSYTLLVASGSTKIPLVCNAVNFIIFIPALFLSIPTWGITAAAAGWLLQNVVSWVVYSVAVNRVVLKESIAFYFRQDIMPFLLVGLLWFSAGKLITLYLQGPFVQLGVICLVTLGYFICFLPRFINVILLDKSSGGPSQESKLAG